LQDQDGHIINALNYGQASPYLSTKFIFNYCVVFYIQLKNRSAYSRKCE